jgi:hypothetical protein
MDLLIKLTNKIHVALLQKPPVTRTHKNFANILWNSKVHYQIYKNPHHLSLFWEKSIQSFLISPSSIPMLSSHLILGNPSFFGESGKRSRYSV